MMKKPFLTGKSLCIPLPSVNVYSKLTINELFEKDPKYAVWMVQNCLAFRYAEDVRRKVNKYKKSLL
jgi:hypothetical protein